MPRYVDHDQRRREVTEVATEILASRGRGALTVRSVAEAAGCSTKVVSHYFADMTELMHSTYSSAAARARLRLEEVIAADATDLQGLMEALLPLDAERRRDWAVWFAFWSEALTSEEFAADQRERARTTAKRITMMLRSLRAQGRLDPGADIANAAQRLSALIPGIAGQVMFDPTRWTPARQRSVVAGELASLGITRAR